MLCRSLPYSAVQAVIVRLTRKGIWRALCIDVRKLTGKLSEDAA
jgi:hypothetical protein